MLVRPARPTWGDKAPSAKMIGTIARSSNSNIAKADRPTAVEASVSGRTRAVDDKASASPSATEAVKLVPSR